MDSVNERKEHVDILAIETSCDETAAAVIRDGRSILSNAIDSQIKIHTEYGGVVPEIEKINRVIEKALSDAELKIEDIDAVAVTYGPGLVGPLLVGVSCAKGLAYAAEKPLIAVNHIKGHIAANYLDGSIYEGGVTPEGEILKPPYLGLVVSGGHTHLIIVEDYDHIKILGRTVDDAAGEAYDKIARVIGLGYPGGPKIDKVAKEGKVTFDFPRAKVEGGEYDFSFSGLKSSVLNHINKMKMAGEDIPVNDIAASFQSAVEDVLTGHLFAAAEECGMKKIAVAGGVAANSALRNAIVDGCKERGYELYIPPAILCTDNAAMIGAEAYIKYQRGEFSDFTLNAEPRAAIV